MKSILPTLLAVALSVGAVQAQAQYVGYTTGSFVRNNGVNFSSDMSMGMAIHLSEGKAQALKGRTIKGIRAMFGTKQLSDLKIFATKELGGTPISECMVTGAATSAKDFLFETPVTIDGDAIYFGYTFTLSSASYKPLMVDYTNDFADGTIYAYANGAWSSVAGKNIGGPSVQLILDEVPEFDDLIMKPFSSTEYFRGGENLKLAAQLFNFGSTTVTSFEVTSKVGDEEPLTQVISGVNIAPNSVYDFTVPGITASTTGFADVSLSITKVNGHDDSDPSDNSCSAHIYIYPQDMKRRLLIENFTGQTCMNCPRGHQEINAIVSEDEEGYAVVSHHAGYYADSFTMTEDGQYTWFFADGNTFAPAAMVNRTPYSGSATTCVFGNNNGLTNDMKSAVSICQAEQPYVSVGLQNTYDPDTRLCKLTAVVHTYNVPSSELHTLNLWLTQDGLLASQTGAGGDYSHDHVFRASLSGTWGNEIELKEGETVTRTYEYTLPDSIEATYPGEGYVDIKYEAVPENMHWVVFVGDVTSSPLTCRVWNANTIALTENGSTTSIAPVENQAQMPVVNVSNRQVSLMGEGSQAAVYSVSGQRVANLRGGQAISLPQGIYLVKCSGAPAQKIVVK